jgi:Tfp pilus assembly protein PilV
MFIFYKKSIITIKAFTILETIFATMIFSVALVALMSVAGQSIISTKNASDEMIASYLNQENIEAVRWYRDEQKVVLGPGAPLNKYMPCGLTMGSKVDCVVMIRPASLSMRPPTFTTGITLGSKQTNVQFEASTGSYYHDSSPSGTTRTKFDRWISIESFPPSTATGETAVVTSTTTWVSRGIRKTAVISTEFKEW